MSPPLVADGSARRRSPLAIALCGLLLAIAVAVNAVFGYCLTFTHFSKYDDEGCLIQMVRLFAGGGALYDQVKSPYGPFFFSLKYLLHRGLGLPLDNSSVRMATLVVWMTTALLIGLATLRVTRRFSLALTAFGLSFVDLRQLVWEPGHPQDLCGLLLVCAVVASLWATPARVARWSVVAGAIAAGLALTKINVGAFATLSIVLAWACGSGLAPGRFVRIARRLAMAAAVLLPFVLLRPVLGTEWGRCYAGVVALSTISLLVAAGRVAGSGAPLAAGPFLASGAAIATISLGFCFVHGTTVHGIVDGLVRAPTRLAASFGWPTPLDPDGVRLALASLVLSMAFAGSRRARGEAPSRAAELILAALKIGFGVAVVRWAVLPDALSILNMATPFLWLVLTPRPAPPRATDLGPARSVLAFVAVLQTLQAYPVSGTQRVMGTFLFIPAAVICLGDVLDWVDSLSRRAVVAVLRQLVLSLGVAGALAQSSLMLLAVRGIHRSLPPLGLRGTDGIRLPESQVATYRWLTTNLERYSDTFLCTIGLNSLYLWTGKPSPGPQVIGNYLDPLDREGHRSLIRSLERWPDACVIYHPTFFDFAGLSSKGPFLDYVDRDFTRCGEVDGYVFYVRRGRAAPRLLDCASWKAREADRTRLARLDLAPTPGRPVCRISVVDADLSRVVADTHSVDPRARLSVQDEDGSDLDFRSWSQRLRLDLSGPRSFTLQWVARPRAPEGFLVVRVFDDRNTMIKSVPFLDRPRSGGARRGGAKPSRLPRR